MPLGYLHIKINHPLFELIIPSTGRPHMFRPFLVREEKVLLMAQQANSDKETLLAIKQVITNCHSDLEYLDIESLLISDFEWIFLQLRARSINNQIELTYIDSEDEKEYKLSLNLDDVKVHQDIVPDKKIVAGEITILMTYGTQIFR